MNVMVKIIAAQMKSAETSLGHMSALAKMAMRGRNIEIVLVGIHNSYPLTILMFTRP